jgi:exodeoxyribonuclease-3
MLIATWNVNSVRARLGRLLPWLQRHKPDVVLLQETKVTDDQFPREPIEDEGYNVVTFGQKTYNGVALLARHRLEAIVRGFPEDGEHSDRRVLGANLGGWILLNLYVPNGQEIGHAKFRGKLDWLRRLRSFLDENYDPRDPIVLGGDFNVTFDDRDVYDPEGLRESIHCSTPERQALGELCGFGLTDALRRFHEEPGIFTWWDHRSGAFQRGHGLRIDHFLMTQSALERCADVWVDRDERKGQGASDHAPVLAQLREE